jgi:hypothetical protein
MHCAVENWFQISLLRLCQSLHDAEEKPQQELWALLLIAFRLLPINKLGGASKR